MREEEKQGDLQEGQANKGLSSFQTSDNQYKQREVNKSLSEMALSAYINRSDVKEKIQSIRKNVNAMSLATETAFKTVGNFIKSLDIEGKVRQLREGAKLFQRTTIRFKEIMLEAGFPPHDFIPIMDMPRLVDIYDKKGLDYTKKVIERYFTLIVYREEILRIIQEKWENAYWLKDRKKILISAINGHLNGYYELTVPTLLAQVEGILVESILLLDEIKENERIHYSKQVNFLTTNILNDNSMFSYDEQIETIYKEIILDGFTPGQEITSFLSRHAILHGADTNYGTRVNSLKSILIFDYLFGKLDEMYLDIEKTKQEIQQRK
ncbi:hypothetical protein [Priestia megaterium]|uniref:hypothetical protein n=1 Tax=Priestia megaterium TaxID=1404 RepID=UPI00196B9D05|nr:hypothetical protein [Priestia megaterium]QSF36965.1 hypothetical protein ICR96_16010 [Priestia megaterium]